MTISGWCASHGRPDQWHDECERRGVRCGCPNHALNKGSGILKRYTWGTSKDGPEGRVLAHSTDSPGPRPTLIGAPN